MRQLLHVAGGMGDDIPVWDIRDNFGDTNLLVTTRDQGADLAASLGQGSVALMRGHGCVVGSTTMKHAVHLAIYVQANASLLLDSIKLGGDITFLSPGEIVESAAMNAMPNVSIRTWDYWVARANLDGV
jgi:ribulose-5-phosphate 4-epimerase/fuculose-1-phosphate aldolase